MEFNDNQKDVINFGKGNLLVEAGPGSGKTTVIVERIKKLIAEGVKPETFLVITFTRKAAQNLQNKLKEFIPKDDIAKMQISTIHSFCLDFLKSRGEVFNLIDDDNAEKKSLFIQKHRKRLGFTGIHTVLNYQIPAVIDKFSEYTNFNVDTKGLVDYIEKTRPISDEYIDFVNSLEFFSKKRIEDNDFKDDWYNARYVQVARAYPIYLEILDEDSSVDYNTVQLKALKELEKNPETGYTTVLVDEFQDTDPLQYRIFEILLENSNYFTAVGDIDQRIYSFRSSYKDYFDEIQNNYDAEIISLNVNYRSTNNIINLTDSFIKHQRKEYSKKKLIGDNNEYDNDSFILNSGSYDEESENILNIIQKLKEKGKILNYNEIAVLFRKNNSKTITELIEHFHENNIPYSIKGQSDLANKEEIKSIITLLWYITRRVGSNILSNDELKWLNFKAFCGVDFNPTFWNLSDNTKKYLLELQTNFDETLLATENEIRKNHGKRPVKALHRIKKNEDADTLIEIFSKVKKPIIDLSKITDINDKKFFIRLDEIKEKIKQEEPTILEVYYDLLSLGDYFDDINSNLDAVENLAMLTETMHNYETILSRTDIRGLFFFLNGVIEEYSSNYSEDNGVQLLTVHTSKGLEFPVTILASLQEEKFPMIVKDPEREKNYIFGKETYYTPNEFLEYKHISIEEENALDFEEEERVVYVAMTRAADLLILSCVEEVPRQINNIRSLLEEFDENKLDEVIITNHANEDDDEKLELNYSKYRTYKTCPFMYNLVYNLNFKMSDGLESILGTVFHNVLNIINQKSKIGIKLSEDEIIKIIKKIYQSKLDIAKDDEEFDDLCMDILDYVEFDLEKYKAIDSEVPFSIEKENYILNGAIDLVYKIDDNQIGVLDYKNTSDEIDKLSKYEEQLYIYASALNNHPDYEKYEIKEAVVYTVYADEKPKLEINQDLLDLQMKEFDNVALNIINGRFNKKESNFCKICNFKEICGRDSNGKS